MKKLISITLILTLALSMLTITASAISKTYYLFGYIDGRNYACESDYQNMGEYKFNQNGKLNVRFNETSYVAVKEANNAEWYMTDGWQGDVSAVRLFSTSITGEKSDKLKIPAGVTVILSLTENGDGSLTLSYSYDDEEAYPIRARLWDYANIDVREIILAPGNYWADETRQPLLKALEKADAALDNLNSTDEELCAAYVELTEAVKNLKKYDEYWFKKFNDKINECSKDFEYQPDYTYYYQFYTKESYDRYREVYMLALGTLTNDVEEYVKLYNELCEAQANLVVISPPPIVEPTEPITQPTESEVSAPTEPSESNMEEMPILVDDTTAEYWVQALKDIISECSADFEQESEYYYQFYTQESYDNYKDAYMLAKGTYSSNISELKFVYGRLKNARKMLVDIERQPDEPQEATSSEAEPAQAASESENTTPATVTENKTEEFSDLSDEEHSETSEPTESEKAKAENIESSDEPTAAESTSDKPTADKPTDVEPTTGSPTKTNNQNPVSVKQKVTEKLPNPAKVSAKNTSVEAQKLKTKKLSVKLLNVKKAKGKVTYKKLGGSKRITVSKDKIVISKRTPKGTYRIRVAVVISGNTKYKSKKIIKTLTIRVK